MAFAFSCFLLLKTTNLRLTQASGINKEYNAESSNSQLPIQTDAIMRGIVDILCEAILGELYITLYITS
jgi:hypothetical protein